MKTMQSVCLWVQTEGVWEEVRCGLQERDKKRQTATEENAKAWRILLLVDKGESLKKIEERIWKIEYRQTYLSVAAIEYARNDLFCWK